VVDLGSGAGFDVFLAANKVGHDGKAIGVDMSKVSRRHPLRILLPDCILIAE
jgi:hypothetical protein